MKWKRILAVMGLILLLSLYVIAVISAFSHSPNAKNWLTVSLFCTIVVRIFIYAFQLAWKVWNPKGKDDSKK